jgi:hypothetical protein
MSDLAEMDGWHIEKKSNSAGRNLATSIRGILEKGLAP